jgi:hypothetical protein
MARPKFCFTFDKVVSRKLAQTAPRTGLDGTLGMAVAHSSAWLAQRSQGPPRMVSVVENMRSRWPPQRFGKTQRDLGCQVVPKVSVGLFVMALNPRKLRDGGCDNRGKAV